MKRMSEVLWTTVIPRSSVFTTAEAAAAVGTPVSQASRDLALLARRNLITRVVSGVWADTRNAHFSSYAVVPALVKMSAPGAVAYVSLLSALSLHGMLSQLPRAIYVVSDRRIRRLRRTDIASYQFYAMKPSLVGGFRRHQSGTFDIATPEKAVFDVLYYSVRKGKRFAHLTGITLPHDFAVRGLMEWIAKIEYQPIRQAVVDRWRVLRARPRDEGIA